MFEEIIAALVRAEVRFVVSGGVAAAIQGSARFTNDIDICYDTASDNVERLVKLLAGWNAYLRGVEQGLPFVMDSKALRITPVMTLTTDSETSTCSMWSRESETLPRCSRCPRLSRSGTSNSARSNWTR